MPMKTLKKFCGAVLIGAILTMAMAASAADKNPAAAKKAETVKP